MEEVRFLGLKRTGNHAIINWYISNRLGCFFYNNLWKEDFIRKTKIQFSKIKNKNSILVYSFEDKSIEYIKNLKSFFKGSQLTNIIILRDPYNLMASRLQKELTTDSNKDKIYWRNSFEDAIDIWKIFAREFLNPRTDLEFILFNKWCSSFDYRLELKNYFKFDFTDRNINVISDIGDGSSFDKLRFQGRGLEMDLSMRWKIFAQNKKYRRLVLGDVELGEFSRSIFGDVLK